MKNIKECATIHIVNSQKMSGKSEKNEFRAACEFYKADNAFHITYKEPETAETDAVRVFIKIQENSVSVRRMGEFKSVINYAAGELCDVLYQTPFGRIDMKIKTDSIENGISEEGGILKISYILFTQGDEITNELFLEIKKEQKI